MRVLVVAHRLEIGGTQVNAIDLAAAIAQKTDIEIVFAATPGPSSALAAVKQLHVHPLPDATRHPSWARVTALMRLADEVGPDLVHVWDWPQCFDAYPGLHLLRRLPILCTEMSMVVPRFIPRHLPTTFGTVQLAERASRTRQGPVHLMEPPVDLEANRPGVVSGAAFRLKHDISADEVLVVMVCRLESWLKLESIERGMAAIDALAERYLVRLAIVGEGSAAARVAQAAEAVNRRHQREVITLTGALVDPREAYEASDLMLGMGGSALRTMAFATALVVVGQQGFSRVLDEHSLPIFQHQGWYGLGSGAPDDLGGQIERLITDPRERNRLGELGAATVRSHYGLGAAASNLEQWYREAANRPVPVRRALVEAGRTVGLRAARSTQRAGQRALVAGRSTR